MVPCTLRVHDRRTKLRLAAGRLLVALGPVRDLLVRAKHLFVAVTVAITSAEWVNDEQCECF